MKNLLFIFCIALGFSSIVCFADQFVPEFDKMQILRCDYEETIFDNDGSTVSTSRQHKIFRIDDTYQKIYDQKEPINNIIDFNNTRIEFTSQAMNDDYISRVHSVIDRTNGTFTSDSQITYDNEMFGSRTSKSAGVCKVLE